MVLALITLAATTPLIATSSIQLRETAESQQDELESELKTEKCHVLVRATSRTSPARKQALQDAFLVLRHGKLYAMRSYSGADHPVTGYFLPYPGRGFDGVVTTIDKENMLNWIYVDAGTQEVKYGVRKVADAHLTGPMALQSQADGERRIICQGWEGFVVVEEEEGLWALYFDKSDDGLRGKLQDRNLKVTEVELVRDSSEGLHEKVMMAAREEDQPD